MVKYNHKKIEKKWQRKWDESGIYEAKDFSKKPKYYCLIEFPYPSGAGLHVGHLRSHIAIDIVARQKRMSGYNVMYPIGWDAFGLPTENFAIKTKTHPKIVTENNIKNFTKQIKSYGPSFDWSREINTTDPEYYKWTQWIFLKLFNSFYDEELDKARDIKYLDIPKDLTDLEKRDFIDGQRLAYEAEMAINWCPSCKIGLANEEVVNNACERCGAPAEKKTMKQWMLKITKYANRLIQDLDTVDYLEKIKTQQVNWIGRSGGAIIKFSVIARESQRPKQSCNNIRTAYSSGIAASPCGAPRNDNIIEVFTTRPDTLFGCTYMVLAPEHFLIEKLKDKVENYNEVKKYINNAKNKSDLDRTDLAKEKTGVELKGIKAINPANNEEIPIWVADYVLATYGTGAIMAVPAHDERDFEFAKKYKINIRQVIVPEDELRSFFMQGSFIGDVKKELEKNNFSYTVNNKDGFYVKLKLSDLDNYKELIKSHLKKEFWCEITGTKTIFIYGDEKIIEINNEQDAIDALKKCKKFHKPMKVHYNLWEMLWNCEFYHDILCFMGNGINVNSDFLNDLETKEAKEKITNWFEKNNLGKKAINYKLRDWVFSRQHYWGEPIPIVKCDKCGNISLKEKDLPLKLPDVKNYEPTDTGESPLAKIDRWVNIKCPKCNGNAKRETDTMPNWAGSSWYFLRYIDPKNNKEFASPEKLKYWMPVDLYNGGMEHTTLHLLYSRFWHKFLYDLGYVNTAEPYKMRRSHGMILAEDGQKMSKSRGNVVNPDEVIKQYGADTVRLYEMFMGPYGDAIPWNTSSLIGMNRFLERVWNMQNKVETRFIASRFIASKIASKQNTILIATNNKGKLKELRDHLSNFNILSLEDINKEIIEPEENGKTFEENSLIKAKYYAKKTGYLTIADDSGLCVNALNGRPGVFSSRYAEGDYKKAHQKLLEELENKKDRSAYYQCVITLYNPENDNYKQFGGKCEGEIIKEPRGNKSFGYAPIFLCKELQKTFGECSEEERYKYNHRKRAADKLVKYLNQNENPEIETLLHQTIKKITEDIENLKFNTAISQIMILANEIDKQKKISITNYQLLITLLSPFAPHITEELWEALENKKSIHLQKWPKYNPELTKEKEIVLVIQINGKVRDQIKVPADISEEEAKKIALERDKIKKWIEGKEIRKIIFVKGKLVNVVV